LAKKSSDLQSSRAATGSLLDGNLTLLAVWPTIGPPAGFAPQVQLSHLPG
jgi:hypothetical protein